MYFARFRTKRRKGRPSADADASSQPTPAGLAPLRAKIREYFGEMPNGDPTQPEEISHPKPVYVLRAHTQRVVQSSLINIPDFQPASPTGYELPLEPPRAPDKGDSPTEFSPPGALDRAIRASKVIEFDYSRPIEGNMDGIRIDNLVLAGHDVNYSAGITVATRHFLAYARSSEPMEQDSGLIYLKSCSSRFYTWLTLPTTFGRNTFITDMTSIGDYLAVTTNEGGALVWEIPGPISQHHFSPTIRLQILPEAPGLKKVKWHSIKTLAFASTNKVYFLDLHEAGAVFCGLPVNLDKLKQIAKVFEVISPIAAFSFDYKTNSIAILSFGGAICFFVIHGDYPIWKATIRGHGEPSSLDIYDWGMLIGWKRGTILQLFAPLSTTVVSTLQFLNLMDPSADNQEGTSTYTCYDSQFRTLWVAHSARSSLLAVRIPMEANNLGLERTNTSQIFAQIAEVPVPLPVAKLSLFSSDANESGNPAEIRMYAANTSGVDCVTITQVALERAHTISHLTTESHPQEQPGASHINAPHRVIPSYNPRSQERTESPDPDQLEALAAQPVRVNREGNKEPGARALPKKIIELDVSTEWSIAKSKTNSIAVIPLVQLTANSISSKPPALFAFDHSQAPGPIFTVNTFLAYGMPKGRIGLVFRHNGARAQLKLPTIYGRNASTIDLAIISNYLACITDGGGAVVWSVPNAYSGRKGTSQRLKAYSCLGKIWCNLLKDTLFHRQFIASFECDLKNTTLAIISVDSVLSLWSLETQRMVWQGRISGAGDPSSLHFIENGVIVGRDRGSTLQLLAPRSVNVLSTFQFTHPLDSTGMYAHLCYDTRLRTLWIVNSERSSLISVRVSMVLDTMDGDTGEIHGSFEKIAEFPTPVPIEGLLALIDADTQIPLLAVATTILQQTRIDLLSIDQSTFEASLQTLSAKFPSKSNAEDFQGISPSLGGEELRRILDPPVTHQYFEPEYQSISASPIMKPKPSKSGINSSGPVKITHPKEMVSPLDITLRGNEQLKHWTNDQSTDEMFECLLQHGCPDLTLSMNPDAYSKGLMAGGGFGDIWKGRLRDGAAVAIKVWRFRTLDEDVDKDIKRAMREIYNWSKLDHENIHKLLGVIIFDGRLGMVSKWMENGNLQSYLQKTGQIDRYPLCIQVAQGVEYLHNIDMIHGDLKAANILVSSDNKLKLTDFDHSIMAECTLQFSETTRMGGGTLRWMAPELVLDSEASHQRNKRTDIYALGMTLLEIITGAIPYSQQCRTDVNIYHALTRKEFPRRDSDCFGPDLRGDRMWALLMRCWDHNPTVRPIAPAVTVSLQTLIRETETGGGARVSP